MQTALKNLLKNSLALLLLCHLNTWADEWSLSDRLGVNYSLSALHGKWVLVNFWAPWCPACLQEIPELVALQNQHKDVQVIGVAVMYKNKKEVMDRAQAIPYPVVFGNEDIASDFGSMAGLPTSYLYTPEGKLAGHHAGPLSKSDIEQVIGQGAAFTR
ncbi:MAG: TlpA disulfide reductase family protein [Gallionella sp.]|nr:TlpA disulfide reductase family protein [Gallionella sp.]